MTFVNPIEILELNAIPVAQIDNAVIKKAKRKLFADIDLSDNGHLNYKGLSITKTDCEKFIDELENQDRLEFYSFLANNQKLNDFLVNGNENIFSSFNQESIYKLPEFIKFINPFFSSKFDRSLVRAFVDNDEEKLRAILRTQNLLTTSEYTTAYKSLTSKIQERIQVVEKITNDISNEESEYGDDDIDQVISVIVKLFPIKSLNALPLYFQSQINKIASAINNLQNEIWSNFNTTSVSLQLLEHLLKLNIESVGKPTFEKNYSIVKRKHEERLEQEKNAPVLKKWAGKLLEIQSQIKSVESKEIRADVALQTVNDLISIDELNKLPSYANEIRTQVAYSIRSLSIACWNKQNDIRASLKIINFALQILVPSDVLLKFRQDKTELEELEKKYKGVLLCHFCETYPPDDSCSFEKTLYKETYRSYFPRRVQFRYAQITIPRCKNCKEIHSKGTEKFSIIFIIALVLGIVIGAATEGRHFVIGGIIGAVLGWIIGKAIEGDQVRTKGIRDTSESSLRTHPLLIDRIKEGWTFSKPSA